MGTFWQTCCVVKNKTLVDLPSISKCLSLIRWQQLWWALWWLPTVLIPKSTLGPFLPYHICLSCRSWTTISYNWLRNTKQFLATLIHDHRSDTYSTWNSGKNKSIRLSSNSCACNLCVCITVCNQPLCWLTRFCNHTPASGHPQHIHTGGKKSDFYILFAVFKMRNGILKCAGGTTDLKSNL